MKYHILSIKKTKNNCFLSISKENGQLLAYVTLKRKKLQDIKNKILWGVMYLFRKIKILKIKIQFIILNVSNLESILIQQIFNILKTWIINIIALKYILSTPHNGCRKTHLSRKRKKKLKKSKKQLLGL